MENIAETKNKQQNVSEQNFPEQGRQCSSAPEPDCPEQDRQAPNLPGASRQIPNLNDARKTFSRIGFSLVVILAAANVASFAVQYIVKHFAAGFEDNILYVWIAGLLPIYIIGLPLGLLVIKNQRRTRVQQHKISFGRWVMLYLIAVAFMDLGNIVGTTVSMMISNLSGLSPDNAVENLMVEGNLLLKILFMAIIAPVIEEFIFRKQIIDHVYRHGEILAIVVSAFCFALFHGNLEQIFYVFPLGLVFGYVYVKTGRLRYTIAMHMVINGFSVFASELMVKAFGKKGIQGIMDGSVTSPEELLANGSMTAMVMLGAYLLFMLAVFIAGMIFFCVKVSKMKFACTEEELPQGGRSAAFINAGMIIYTVLAAGSVVFSLTQSLFG